MNKKILGCIISSYNKENNYYSCTVSLEMIETKINLKIVTYTLSNDTSSNFNDDYIVKYVEVGTIFNPQIKVINNILHDINKTYNINSKEWLFSDRMNTIMSCSSVNDLIKYYLNESIKISRNFKLQKINIVNNLKIQLYNFLVLI